MRSSFPVPSREGAPLLPAPSGCSSPVAVEAATAARRPALPWVLASDVRTGQDTCCCCCCCCAAGAPSLIEYCAAVQELTILCLIAEGLGLDGGFFAGDLSGGDTHMSINYYPPCPDPTVTMGLFAHCDRHLLTVLSQADIAGLQARHGERWLLVHPIPGAFVVNFGHQMEMVTNGVLASVEHLAVTNSAVARMSMATHVNPTGHTREPHRRVPHQTGARNEAMNPANTN
nr:2'-deoxymugineic-acid 2'-dioxygenase-like [Aegilops tauschii subsp. strangulata]